MSAVTTGRAWTVDEDAALRAAWPSHEPLAVIAHRLSRTPRACVDHARALGLPALGRGSEVTAWENASRPRPAAPAIDHGSLAAALIVIAWLRGALTEEEAIWRLGVDEAMGLRLLADRMALTGARQ